VVIAGLGTGLGLGLSTSPPPQWCGPLLAELQVHTGGHGTTFQGLMSSLSRIERQDDAPVGKLMWDLRAQVQSGSPNYLALGNVITDLQSLNRACQQPPSAYANDIS
jgi:hypothetical protein